MPAPDLRERLALEHAVEDLRRFNAALHTRLLDALRGVAAAEARVLLGAGADVVLHQQGRASHAHEIVQRIEGAYERLEDAEKRARADQQKPRTNRNQ